LRTKDLYKRVYLPELVGKGYKAFWNYKGRYRVVKGSRGSKKSKTMALWTVYSLMKYPEANMLVIRRTGASLKTSCYTEIEWAINRLGVARLWKMTVAPLEATYIPTGQKIYFRGLDEPLKLTSIAVKTGTLCWLWIEEAYEIRSEADFDTIDEVIRGATASGVFKQATLTFNPWNSKHWLKRRFFDTEDSDVLALTTTYECNEWLDEQDLKLFERMKERNPRRYRVAGLGDWGIVEGLVYENIREYDYTLEEIRNRYNLTTICGLDFGYTNDPTAYVIAFIDQINKRLFIWDEIYEKGLSNRAIYDRIVTKGYAKERVVGDSAEPKSIDELASYGLRIIPAVKGPDSIMHGIQYLQDFEILVHPRCQNFLLEAENYTWQTDKTGSQINRPIDDFNHLLDALRYAVEGLSRGGSIQLFTGGL